MNGNGRQASFSSSRDSRYGLGRQSQVQPSSKVLLEGYRSTLDSSNEEHPRYNPLNKMHPRSSSLLNSDDPVSMHLLMETAMGDSQQYEVLSFEETDALKKELTLLSTRIDATKRKLTLESKLRDAAQSLNRLYTPNGRESTGDGSTKSPKRHRRSMMGSRSSGSDLLTKTDDELAVSTRKCEGLAQELWKLEHRAQELNKRLLEHTAGVLQMTHKGFLKKGMPLQSPDSMSDYANGRDSSHTNLTLDFDDRSFYQTLDGLLEVRDGQEGGLDPSSKSAFAQQNRTILETEKRLEDLNQRLRDSIAQSSTSRQSMLAPPARVYEDQEGPEMALQEQLSYLEKGLEVLQQDRNVVSQNAKQSAYATEERLEDLNSQLHGIISRSGQEQNSRYPLPPQVSGQSTKEQIGYLEGGLDTVEQSVQRMSDESRALSSKAIGHEEKADQFETVLLGLWDILTVEEEDSGRRDQEYQSVGSSMPHGSFSLQLFSTRVQSLHVRVTEIQEQKDILARQVQQQRDLNSKSDTQKDAQLSDQTVELERTKKALNAKDSEVNETRTELILLTDRLDAVRQEASLHEQQNSTDVSNALRAERQARIESEERLYTELQAKKNEVEKLKVDEASLREAVESRIKQSEKAQNEMKKFEGEMVRLQTELTVARAELDGAYGTRAQRAAEGAPNPAIQREVDDLTERNTSLLNELDSLKSQHRATGGSNADMSQRVETLQRELSETIGEYEVMTKAGIEFEKEREHLEGYVDGLRDRCENLESQLSDEKLRWLGVNSQGAPGGRDSIAPGTTSTMVLKNEFKKMMRETRAENMKALRFEQDERRKLEALVRTLKRDQPSGKSSLSQSMTAH